MSKTTDTSQQHEDTPGDTAQGFVFVNLAGYQLTPGRPFAGFAAGNFTDMHGRPVELAAADISDYVANTNARITAYKQRNMPGLPIDARQHDKGDAAGWIIEATEGQVTDTAGQQIAAVTLVPEWTDLGADLLKRRIQTNFSPTVNLTDKVIVGGSLTNWPATVDAAGVPLLAAVELAQGMTTFEPVTEQEPTEQPATEPEPAPIATDAVDSRELSTSTGVEIMTLELTQEQLDELVANRVKDTLAELNAQRPEPEPGSINYAELAQALGLATDDAEAQQVKHLDQLAELIEQQAQLKWQQKLSQMQRQNQYAELAARVTGGTPDAPRGIPTDADRLRDELLKLTPDQAKYWGGLLENVTRAGLTDFSELGHGKRTKQQHPVPDYAVDSLKAALAAGASPEEFFTTAGLGSASDYDLSAYVKKEEK